MANFAKTQLMKYGWTEGKGLGKNEDGITTALRPKLKFDTNGIGHKDDNSNQWWETAFNKAASSIIVDPHSNEVSISAPKEDTKNKKAKKLKSTLSYGNFLKTSTLCDGHLIQQEGCEKAEVESDDSTVIIPQLTDEELFKACGGRTAHKGARHGLTLNGKLERIAQQEKQLLDAITSGSTLESSAPSKKKRKKEMKKQCKQSQEDNFKVDSNANTVLPPAVSLEEEPCVRLSKKTKQKRKRRMNDLTHQLNLMCNMNDEDTEQRLGEKIDEEICSIPLPPSVEAGRKRNKWKKGDTQNTLAGDEHVERKSGNQGKEKWKRKRSLSRQNRNSTVTQTEQEKQQSSKKSKKWCHREDNDVVSPPKEEYMGFILEPNTSCGIAHQVSSSSILDSSLQAERHDIRKTYDAFTKTEADRLNRRIKKKKKSMLRRKQRLKLERITESLKAVHFDGGESPETADAKQYMKAVAHNFDK